MKYAVRLTRLALSSMLGVLNQETFTVRSVRELMWGYSDSLFKLAKDVMPPENVVPHDEFGLFVGVRDTFNYLLHIIQGHPICYLLEQEIIHCVCVGIFRKTTLALTVRLQCSPVAMEWPTTPTLTTGTVLLACRLGALTRNVT